MNYCICSSSKEEHKCNGICQFEKDSRRGCKKYCKFSICEEHVCSCENPEEEHICQNYCSLKDLSLEGTCNEYCIKPVGHEGECSVLQIIINVMEYAVIKNYQEKAVMKFVIKILGIKVNTFAKTLFIFINVNLIAI